MPKSKTKQREEAAEWERRIDRAKEYRKPFEQSWKKSLDMYKLKFGEIYSEDEDKFDVPWAYMHHHVKVPSIYTRMPKIRAKGMRKEDLATEDLIEKVLKDIFKKSGFEDELKMICLIGIITGTAWVKIGHTIKTETVPLDNEEAFDAELHTIESDGTLTEEIMTEHGLWIDMVDSKDISFDPEAEKLESCRWLSHRIAFTKKKFRKLFPRQEIPESAIEIEEGIDDTRAYSKTDTMSEYVDSEDAKRVIVYEIWDKENMKYYVMAKGGEKFLKEQDWIYDNLKKYPFELLIFDECPGSIYGLNTVYLQKDIIREKGAITRRKVQNAKQCKSTTVYDKGAMDEKQADNLAEPIDKGILEVIDVDRIKNLGTPPIPQEAFIIDHELGMMLGDTAGTTPENRLQESKRRETATQVSTRNRNSQIQVSADGAKFERFVARIAEKLIPLLKEFYVWPEETRIDGQRAESPQFIQWTGANIGEYDFEVKVGSAAWQDIGIRSQQLNTQFQLIVSAAQIGAIPNPKPGLIKVLTKQFDNLDMPADDIEEMFRQPEMPIIPPGQQGATGTPGSPSPRAPTAQASEQGGAENLIKQLLAQRTRST